MAKGVVVIGLNGLAEDAATPFDQSRVHGEYREKNGRPEQRYFITDSGTRCREVLVAAMRAKGVTSHLRRASVRLPPSNNYRTFPARKASSE